MYDFIYIAGTYINLGKVTCAKTSPSGICTRVFFNDGTSVDLEGVTAKDFYEQRIAEIRKGIDLSVYNWERLIRGDELK